MTLKPGFSKYWKLYKGFDEGPIDSIPDVSGIEYQCGYELENIIFNY